MFAGGVRRPVAVVTAAVLALGLAACGSSSDDEGTISPGTVSGLPVSHFQSGLRSDAPSPDLKVKNVSAEESDKLAMATIADVSSFWDAKLPENFGTKFEPVKQLTSYESNGPNQTTGCGDTKKQINAFYCGADDSVAWDRGVLLPMLLKKFGPMAVVVVLGHEFGHAVQYRVQDQAGISRTTPTIVKEQQADCFAGTYFRWIAEDKSKYFRVSTSEGLSQVMAAMYMIRDQAGGSATEQGAHGSAFDRTYAFQLGFEKTPKDCAGINLENTKARITEKVFAQGKDKNQKGDSRIDEDVIGKLKKSLDGAFSGAGAQPPQIVADGGSCPNGPSTPPASYCPATNTVSIDLPALQALGKPALSDEEKTESDPGGMGDFAVFAEVASRYTQGIQKAVGASIDNTNAGLRTACLVGAWAAVTNQKGQELRLSPGDLDEAIGDLLQPTSLVAADVNGKRVDSGFARVESMRRGFMEGSPSCSQLYG
ncbi:neutral zinc metallopeptidase [Amycolatopsis sp. CA-230715]|uniref:neutral zinc metallopeptidase n=1 Tax=Amycolatopsis sp. CA-230715 TaxID=2745196 RepID=UPI001C030826|nr:neutral zinc metallopeptidase [Amycolatopsis sp. CA-230715]QWF82799.1 hypothetical protein HUW46_06238 [Amycolatopsis sp. CA-230715]